MTNSVPDSSGSPDADLRAARDLAARRQRRRGGGSSAMTPEQGRPWLTPARLLSLVMVLVVTYAALTIVVALRTVLVMLLVAVFLSFAMEPAVQWLSQRGWRRGFATAAVFFAVFLIMAAIAAALANLVVRQVQDLTASLPRLLEQVGSDFDLPVIEGIGESPELQDQVTNLRGGISDQLRRIALGAAGNVVTIGATVFGVVFQLLSIALVTFYLVADGPRARQALARPLPPDRQREMLAIWELAVAKTGGYIYSRLLLAAVSTLTTALVLMILGVPNPIPLAIIVGATGVFIPVVGTYIGGVLVLLVAFGDQASRGETPTKALWVLVFLVLYQQLENYLLAPRVQARTMDVHPAVAFISVLVGGTLLGAVGALLALPATAILQALLSTYVRRHELIAELAEIELPQEAGRRTAPAAATAEGSAPA